MTEESPKHHGYTDASDDGDEIPEPSHAERARTLLTRAQEGTLATQSRRHPGFPFASLMPYALDPAGHPLVLVSDLAVHTRNLKADDRASLLVTEPQAEDRNALGLARVTLMGPMPATTPEETEVVREIYLERHSDAGYWVDYPDFHFRRMEVQEIYYVGGFGVMGWVAEEDYRDASPDPLRDAAPGIIQHMNEDHADALAILARWKGMKEVEGARMKAVDRLGYHLGVRTAEGMRSLRIPFPEEARSPSRVRKALVDQVARAREELG
jgi:heme iron utilization protein